MDTERILKNESKKRNEKKEKEKENNVSFEKEIEFFPLLENNNFWHAMRDIFVLPFSRVWHTRSAFGRCYFFISLCTLFDVVARAHATMLALETAKKH